MVHARNPREPLRHPRGSLLGKHLRCLLPSSRLRRRHSLQPAHPKRRNGTRTHDDFRPLEKKPAGPSSSPVVARHTLPAPPSPLLIAIPHILIPIPTIPIKTEHGVHKDPFHHPRRRRRPTPRRLLQHHRLEDRNGPTGPPPPVQTHHHLPLGFRVDVRER